MIILFGDGWIFMIMIEFVILFNLKIYNISIYLFYLALKTKNIFVNNSQKKTLSKTHQTKTMTTPRQQTPKPKLTAPQKLKLQPLLTYNSTTQQLQLHQCSYMGENQICFVSLVEVKGRDLGMFGIQGDYLGKTHGVYVTVPVGVEYDGKCGYISYVVLLSNQSKTPQKYQDLFASLTLTISTTCVFDISSKYLRQSKNTQNRPQRNNYVIMNTYNNKIGQIYKASVVTIPQSQNSKMEISTKMVQERSAIFQEFVGNWGVGYRFGGILRVLGELGLGCFIGRNYTSFQEFQYQFLASIRLNQFLSEKSSQFNQLQTKQEMLSINQLKSLQNSILEQLFPQITTNQQMMVLNKTKAKIIQQLSTCNIKLTGKFLASLKKQFFESASSLTQISIKKQLSLKILEEYGIDPENVSILCYEAQTRLQYDELNRVNGILREKQTKIEELSANLEKTHQIIAENSDKLNNYEKKFLDFKQLNIKYISVCSELEQQRQQSLQHKQYITKILKQKQQHIKIEQNLSKLLSEMQQNKSTQQTLICSLHTDLRNKEHYIYNLKNKNEESEKKLQGYNSLEDKAWRSIEDAQQARNQLQRYKELLRSLEEHFDAFKRSEFEKFNYILKSNAQMHRKVKKQSQQKSALIQQQNKKIAQLNTQLEAQKSRIRYCMQQLNIHAHAIHKTISDPEIKLQLDEKTLQNNRSYISVV